MTTHIALELVGFGPLGLKSAVGKTLKRISWPTTQSNECTWRLEVIWEGQVAWTITATPTLTESGHEMGSLRIEESPECSLPQDFRRRTSHFDDFVLEDFRVASAFEGGVATDCAISLGGAMETRLMIATAPAPGAVAFWENGRSGPKTEFDQKTFVWKPIT